MGIYIDNIEMPKGHDHLTINIWPNGTTSYGVFNRQENLCTFKETKAISVPSHGELIDRDALVDIFRGFIAMYDSYPFNQSDFARRNELQSVLVEVMNAPTVLPAEEGEI